MKFEEIFQEISYRDLSGAMIEMMGHEYMLLTAGNASAFNTMTVGWGGFGYTWQRPVAWVFVRPQRHTYRFVEQNERFTLTYFGSTQQKALSICGSLSGRDTDKVLASGLSTIITPDSLISFEESLLIFSCRKVYFEDLNPENILDKSILRNYPANDFHRVYTAQIENIWERR
jgi:flavin reductase (DIM6/NTAB) family NADH-FMN oxidoreductase RutF